MLFILEIDQNDQQVPISWRCNGTQVVKRINALREGRSPVHKRIIYPGVAQLGKVLQVVGLRYCTLSDLIPQVWMGWYGKQPERYV